MAEMKESLFRPKKVFIDKAVKKLAYTAEILDRLGDVEREIVADPEEIKSLTQRGWKEKTLFLTRYQSDCLQEFPSMSRITGRPTYSLNLVTNCHLGCSYCILQGYLANSPVVTLYANIDEIMESLSDQIERIPRGSVVGTGQTADSLALEELTGLHQRLIPFFAQQDRVTLEMKTKCADVTSILPLKHGGQTVVSWSIAPERVQSEEEFNTASIPDRITAMQACQKAHYKIGLHFDPVIHHTGWEKNYKKLVDQLFASLDEKKVRWVSIGALRFPVNQVALMRERFPNNRRIFNNLVSGKGRFMHYPERLRDAIYRRMREYLHPYISEDKIYISMEAESAVKESS